ncbi:MAG: ABC transporter permease subunit [Candidatus Lokiarchaeota archaeon]|nr:ABC transporter permease subunit [Candidatus Lokiarchaeota archaeon]
MNFKKIIHIYKKYGVLTISFIVLSTLLLIILIVPIINVIFQEDPITIITTLLKERVITAIVNSFVCSLLATIFALILGIPLAYLLARYEFPGKRIIDSLLDLPILIPHSVAGIILLIAFGQNGIFGQFFNLFGIRFYDSYWGIILAMFFVSCPFLIKGARDVFTMVNPNYEKAARTLGASRFRTFIDITLSLSWRGIISSSILCWARGISEFGAVYILVSMPVTGPVLVAGEYTGSGLSAALPIAIALVLVSLLIFILLKLIQGPTKKDKRSY